MARFESSQACIEKYLVIVTGSYPMIVANENPGNEQLKIMFLFAVFVVGGLGINVIRHGNSDMDLGQDSLLFYTITKYLYTFLLFPVQ